MKIIEPGIRNQTSMVVAINDLATAYGSGDVEVFATPAMIALMERTALESINPLLDTSQTTVGFEMNVRHFKAVSLSEEVISTASLLDVQGKKLSFEVEVLHKGETVGKGSHIRYVVDKKIFR